MLYTPSEIFVNRLRRERDPLAAHIKLPVGADATLRALMLHRGCFPHMNGLLFAPDGTFVFSREDILDINPRFITSRLEGREGSYQYSNGNYILLGIILELALGVTLDEALNDLVFQELNMDCSTVDRRKVEMNGSRVVQGFQLSADLSPMAVNSTNLLRDGTESSAMGLRSSLDDIAKFNLELLRRLDAKSSADMKPAELFDFFVGEESTFGGLVSRPAEGVFQSETPTFYLRADYKPTPLGKLNTKFKMLEQTRAAARRTFRPSKRDLTKLINHKAGYIDGHSSNVIVFENQGDVLIIVANSTGACDVVHHMSRYLLQEILGLFPQITAAEEDADADTERETKACTKTLKSLEQSILLGEHDVHNPEDRLIGTYHHEDCAQRIVIQADGKVFFRGSDPDKVSSPMLMAYGAGNGNAIRLFLDATHLPLEAWSVWNNLNFQVLDVDNVVGLSHEGGNGVYLKV